MKNYKDELECFRRSAYNSGLGVGIILGFFGAIILLAFYGALK